MDLEQMPLTFLETEISGSYMVGDGAGSMEGFSRTGYPWWIYFGVRGGKVAQFSRGSDLVSRFCRQFNRSLKGLTERPRTAAINILIVCAWVRCRIRPYRLYSRGAPNVVRQTTLPQPPPLVEMSHDGYTLPPVYLGRTRSSLPPPIQAFCWRIWSRARLRRPRSR